MQLGLLLHKRPSSAPASAPRAARARATLATGFVDELPFALTPYQLSAPSPRSTPTWRARSRCAACCRATSARARPSSPSTACCAPSRRGMQGAFMAPTETLAEQHFETSARSAAGGRRVELLTSRLTAAERRDALARIAAGEASIVVGTHALIQERRVVRQPGRWSSSTSSTASAWPSATSSLRAPSDDGHAPHVLHMTATPIPRTLALTFYGDLDVTTIEGSPAGRSPVVTRLVDEEKRDEGYEFVRKQLDRGRQVYVVCPAIEESEAISAATAAARRPSGCAARPVARLPRRGAARPAQDGRARAGHGGFQGRRGRRARRHQPHRGRHRRAQRDRDDRRGRRALRPRAAAPASRARRARGRTSRTACSSSTGRDAQRRTRASRPCSRRTTGSCSPTATSRSAARGRCSARARRACPT